MKVAISLKNIAAFSFPSSPSPAEPLNHLTLACTRQLTTRTSPVLLGHSDVWVTPADMGLPLLLWARESSTAGEQAPHAALAATGWNQTALADTWLAQLCCCRSCPTSLAPRRTHSSPSAAPWLHLWLCFSSPCGTRISLVLRSMASLSKQAGDAGQRGKARQNACLAFPSPCMLKFVPCLISSARWFEIISVTFLLLFIYPNLSHFLLQTVPLLICLISLPVKPRMEKALLLQGRGVQTGYNHSVNVHDPVLEKLSCCQQLKLLRSYVINHLGEVIATSHWERKVLCCFWPQGLRYTKNHRIFWIETDPQGSLSPTLKGMVKSSCEGLSVSFAVGQLQLL